MLVLPQGLFRHGGIPLPWRSLLLGATALLLFLLAGAAPEALVFDRRAILHGELWRLLSAHWVHSDLEHAFWDITALLILGCLFEPLLGRRLIPILLSGTIAVDAWLWWGMPMLDLYCGLSAILNTLMVAGLWELWRERRHPLIVMVGLGAAMKIILEITTHQAIFTHTAWPSVPETHAVGFLTAVIVATLTARRSRIGGRRSSDPQTEVIGEH